jgi:hypothetical protein
MAMIAPERIGLVEEARAAGMSSSKPFAVSSSLSDFRSSRQVMPLVMVLSRRQVGVTISSRY